MNRPTHKPKAVGSMSPRELLHLFAYLGYLNSIRGATAAQTHIAPAKGPRGARRRAKKLRLRAHRARLQRVSWCSYGEAHKREARA